MIIKNKMKWLIVLTKSWVSSWVVLLEWIKQIFEEAKMNWIEYVEDIQINRLLKWIHIDHKDNKKNKKEMIHLFIWTKKMFMQKWWKKVQSIIDWLNDDIDKLKKLA